MTGENGSDELVQAEREVSRARVAFTQSSRTASKEGARTLALAWRRARPFVVGAVLVGGLLGTAALVAAMNLRRRKRMTFVIRMEPRAAARPRNWTPLAFAVARAIGGMALRRLVQRRPSAPAPISARRLPSVAYQAE